jgi:hypothetical protein
MAPKEMSKMSEKGVAIDRLSKALLSFSTTVGETRRIYMELLGYEDDMNAVEDKKNV